MHDLLKGEKTFLEKYRELHGYAVYAANLCGSMHQHAFNGLEVNDIAMTAVVSKLLEQKNIIA